MASTATRDVAVAAARAAGQLIRDKVHRIERVMVKSAINDLVTDVDRQAEELIREHILKTFPEHDILGEEGVAPGWEASDRAIAQMRDCEHLWIIDPIDGTTNFVHGFPYFCVSIALAVRGELQLGVIYNPMWDEWFIAEKGKGATLNGETITVSGERSLDEALLATGFPHVKKDGNRTDGILKMARCVRNIRTPGSAALNLAYVASGRFSGYWDAGLNAWDVAAGVLLVTEAGGKVTDTLGRPYTLNVRNILATNMFIHDQALHTLKEVKDTGF